MGVRQNQISLQGKVWRLAIQCQKLNQQSTKKFCIHEMELEQNLNQYLFEFSVLYSFHVLLLRLPDENECKTGVNNCSLNADCNDLMPGFSCSCKSGFTGGGYLCSDINECGSTPCNDTTVCQNTFGGFTCIGNTLRHDVKKWRVAKRMSKTRISKNTSWTQGYNWFKLNNQLLAITRNCMGLNTVLSKPKNVQPFWICFVLNFCVTWLINVVCWTVQLIYGNWLLKTTNQLMWAEKIFPYCKNLSIFSILIWNTAKNLTWT